MLFSATFLRTLAALAPAILVAADTVTLLASTTVPISSAASTITSTPVPSSTSFLGPIHADERNKCLDVRGAVFADGTPVQIFDCNGSGAQNWVLSRGATKVQVNGTNFCLDAGSAPMSGVGMKIWTCFDNLPAQEWFYTDDNRIALAGQGQCLDVTNGAFVNSNQVQTWQCTDGNFNQVWTV